MNQPLPDEESAARARAARKAWWAAHPNYRAEYNAKNRERDLPRKRDNERLRQARLKAEATRRAQEVQRATNWAKANPEKRREARERYKTKNREEYRAQQRDYYHRNKEKISARRQARDSALDPEQLRERRSRDNAAARAVGRDPGSPSQEQRDRYLAQQREKKQIDRRLKQSGLPPRRLSRTLVSERRATVTAAEHFFSRKRSRAEVRRAVEGDYSARAAPEGPVAPELLTEWGELTKKIRQRGTFRDEVRTFIRENEKQLREDIALDSRVRELRGHAPLHEAVEGQRRARAAVARMNTPNQVPDLPSALPPEPSLQSRAPAVRRRPAASGSSAPHVFPGTASSGPGLN